MYVNTLVGDIKVNPKDFYRYTNSQRKDYQGIPPLKRRNGSGLAESKTEQAEEFNGQFTVVFSETSENEVPDELHPKELGAELGPVFAHLFQ